MLEEERRDNKLEEIIQEIPAAYQHPDLWIYQLDSSDIVSSLEHLLRGQFWDRNKNEWKQKGNPLLNEDGIKMMVTIVASHMSKEKILTDIPKDQIMRMCRDMRLAVVNHLTMKYNDYKVKKADLDIILEIVDHYIYMNLSRSLGGRTLEYFKPTIRRIEKIQPSEEKRSMFGWVPFFGGK